MPSIRAGRLLWLILFCELALLIAIQSAGLFQKIDSTPIFKKPTPGVVVRPRPADPGILVRRFEFKSPDSLKSWEEKAFKGRSSYEVLREDGETFLRATSRGTASGLFQKISQPLSPDLRLAWRWRATSFPAKNRPEELSDRSQDDFAARLYVIFPGSSFYRRNVIEYLWDKEIRSGVWKASPYLPKVKLFVIHSGPAPADGGGWIQEERNIFNDYRQLFGENPKKPIDAIALMTDSDNTQSSSGVDFGEIIFKLRKSTPAGGRP